MKIVILFQLGAADAQVNCRLVVGASFVEVQKPDELGEPRWIRMDNAPKNEALMRRALEWLFPRTVRHHSEVSSRAVCYREERDVLELDVGPIQLATDDLR